MTQTNQPNRRCAEEYTVKRGDSFYLIAHKLGVPLRDLLAANSEIHPARLMVGDVLCIPREQDDSPECGGLDHSGDSSGNTNGSASGNAGISPDPALACPVTEQYTVEPGQTVADLQLRNLVSRHTLETANPDVNLDTLTAGQTICIPPENVPCNLPETYTLLAGETLESVAMRFNLPVASLLRVNPCFAPQDFEPGATVVLPR
ncbi:MAG: LysM peptidoglycan-binding domain-containing protein [Clostridia bacterium]|nr:LysM peptidoglycan-binding domain-containing protein [Clostridia bacterium]